MFSLFDEVLPHSPEILLGLAALWLSFTVVLGLWASRIRRRWVARLGIAASFVIFVAGWLSASPLCRLLTEAAFLLSYPANRHFFRADPYALVLVMLAASNVVGIVGIWAGASKPRRFLGVLAIAAIAPLLLVVGAYEPCVVLFVQSVVIIVPLIIARNIRGLKLWRRPTTLSAQRVDYGTHQFSVLDLLAIALLTAIVLGVAVPSPEPIVVHEARHQFTIILPSPPSPVLLGTLGVVLGLVMLLAAWVTLGHGVWWLRVMGSFLAWPGVLCTLWLVLWREATGRHFRIQPPSAADDLDRDSPLPLRRALGCAGLILLSLLILAPLGIVYYHLAFPPPIPEAVLPDPNGYDELLAASETLDKTLQDQGIYLPALWNEASASEVVACRVLNRSVWNATLREVRAALDRPSRVPLRYRAIEYGRYESMDDLASALRIEGKAAASEGRILDAIRCFSDMIRLGRAAGTGGLSIDWLADCSIEEHGIEQFHDLTRSLDAAQCRTAIKTLAAEDKAREPFEDVWQRERVWGARALGWSGRMYMLIDRLTRQNEQWMRQVCTSVSKRTRAELRIAMTELAVRAYSLDHNRLPDNLAQLVPDYLPAVLMDPLTDQPLVYELNKQGFVVYSLGIVVGWAAPPQTDR